MAVPLPRLLWLFAGVNLVVGSGAFVLGGILVPLAQDLDVSVPAAGQAMTAYALATALLAPLVLLLTGRWTRRRALLLALALFALGSLLSTLAPSFEALLAGRVLMGAGAAFTPLAAGIAVALVPPARRGQALALTFLGMSLSYAVGVPLGAWLGLAYGWRVPTGVFALFAAVALAAVAWRVPEDIHAAGADFRGLPALLARADVIGALLVTLAYFTAIFVVFSYIGPVLQALVPMERAQQALTLALFGLSGVLGTVLGGYANDRFGARRTLALQLTVLGSTMALLPFTRGSWPALVAVLVVWGTAGFGMMAPQQSRLASLAPGAAPLLMSLNTSMLYFGTAAGAMAGGALALRLGYAQLAWAGVPFVALALAILAAGHTFTRAAPIGRQENATP